MTSVNSDYTVKCYECVETETAYYFVLEYCDGGNLYFYLVNNGSTGLEER
jgi:serine/threonine protein kinase